MKLTGIEAEELRSIMGHPGTKALLKIIDDITENIKGNVLSVPLDKDPAKAQLQLYTERMKYEGANALRVSLAAKLNELKEKR